MELLSHENILTILNKKNIKNEISYKILMTIDKVKI